MLITNAAIQRRGTVYVLMFIAVVVGIYSYLTLPRESNPDITIPYVLVVTNYEGVASEDVESLITLPIERKLKGLKEVEEIRSVSAEGSSMITIEFHPDVDIDDALQWVRDKVDQSKGDLPNDLEEDPSILEINLSEFPILMVAISGDVGETVLKGVSEELEERIEEIPGVLDVVLTGARERQVRVEFDPDRLAAYRLSFAEILAAIQRENVNIPGGSIDLGEGKYLLRIPGEFTDPNQIDNLVMVTRDGRPIYYKDVATVDFTFEDRLSHARLGGKESISLAVKKRTGENIIAVADQVFALLEGARDLVPEGISLEVTLNQSKDIRRMVSELENNILTGLILVVAVLFLFLGLRNSLFVALVINPVLCAGFMRLRPKELHPQEDRTLVVRLYRKTLETALDHSWLVALAAFGLLIGVSALYGKFGHGLEFLPDTEPNRAFVEIKAPEGTRLDSTDALVRQVEKLALAEADIRFVTGEAGVAPSGEAGAESGGQSHMGKVSMEFVERIDRRESSDAVLERLRRALADFAGAEIKVEKEQHGPPTGPPINIEISGENIETLDALVAQARKLIAEVPGLVDLKDDFARAKPEIQILVDREKASLLNLSTSEISNMVKAAVSGSKLGNYRYGQDEYDIVVRLPEDRRQRLVDIENLLIPTPGGDPVPISTVATIRLAAGFGSIRHLDQKRVVTISANTLGRNSNEVLKEVQAQLVELKLPGGYQLAFSGEQEEQQKAIDFLGKAFLAALFLISLVLVTQFNSLSQTLIVMTSVILSLTGVLIGLLVTITPFGVIMTGIGVISLAGVVVNNAIVLIDYINQLRAQGLPLREALIRAGTVRFRPVMLTAVTTILGLLPMAVGISFDFRSLSWEIGGESAEWWGPMAVAVIFGLTFATLLTLVVVPVLYRLMARWMEKKDVEEG